MTTPPGDLLRRAVSFAARAHRHQIRKDGRTPYVAHAFRVAMSLRTLFGCDDETVLTAAVLHDTIEDTTTDYDDLQKHFGGEVADLVAALTKNMALPETRREPEYDRQLAAADWRARLIKLGDALDNLCDSGEVPPDLVAERRDDAREKCRRALALAAPDAHRPPVAAAIRILESCLRSA